MKTQWKESKNKRDFGNKIPSTDSIKNGLLAEESKHCVCLSVGCWADDSVFLDNIYADSVSEIA